MTADQRITSPPTRLTRAQVREVDRVAIERYGIPGIVLMENAARGAAEAAWEMLGCSARSDALPGEGEHSTRLHARPRACGCDVVILCGGGNNGGDGLAVARHLHNRGVDVLVGFTVDPRRYQGDAATNWNIIRAMNVSHTSFTANAIGRPRLIIDAIFGTGLTEPPRVPFPELATAVNASGVPVLAIDLPSGLDCDTGRPLGPECICATHTVTFVAEKVGFAAPWARTVLGRVTVVDIGCPQELIDEVVRRHRG